MGLYRISLSESFYVLEDAIVNAVDDRVGPKAPVLAGPHLVLIGGGAFEASAAVWQRNQDKVGTFRLKVMVFQMADADIFAG